MGSSFCCSWCFSSTGGPRFPGGLTPFVDDKKGERYWWSYLWELVSFILGVFIFCLFLIFCIWICILFYGHMLCMACICFWGWHEPLSMYGHIYYLWYGSYPYCLYIHGICGLFIDSFIIHPFATYFLEAGGIFGWMEGNSLCIHFYNSVSLLCIDG